MSNLLLVIFFFTTPVSVYLQSKNINYLQAWKMIVTLIKQIKYKKNDNYILNLYKKC